MRRPGIEMVRGIVYSLACVSGPGLAWTWGPDHAPQPSSLGRGQRSL